MTDEQSGSLFVSGQGLQIQQPKLICTCDVFGQGQITISFYENGWPMGPVPNRWTRFWMTIFFNSKWNFETDD